MIGVSTVKHSDEDKINAAKELTRQFSNIMNDEVKKAKLISFDAKKRGYRRYGKLVNDW